MGRLTRYRREVLERLAEGPKTLEDARAGHPNIMPTLIRMGLAQSLALGDPRNYWTTATLYEITEAGRLALDTKGEGE